MCNRDWGWAVIPLCSAAAAILCGGVTPSHAVDDRMVSSSAAHTADRGGTRSVGFLFLEVPSDPSYGDEYLFRYGTEDHEGAGFLFCNEVNGLALPDSLGGVADDDGSAAMTLHLSDPAHHLIIGSQNEVRVRFCDGGAGYADGLYYWTILDEASSVTGSSGAGSTPPLLVYPNPATNLVQVQVLSALDEPRASIVDATGRIVRHLGTPMIGGGITRWSEAPVDLTGRRLAPGAYWIRVSLAGEQITHSLVVK